MSTLPWDLSSLLWQVQSWVYGSSSGKTGGRHPGASTQRQCFLAPLATCLALAVSACSRRPRVLQALSSPVFFSVVPDPERPVRVRKPVIPDPAAPSPPVVPSDGCMLLCSYLHTNREMAVAVWRPCPPTSRAVPVAAGHEPSTETSASLGGSTAFAEAMPLWTSSSGSRLGQCMWGFFFFFFFSSF